MIKRAAAAAANRASNEHPTLKPTNFKAIPRRRRVVIMEERNFSFGFPLHSYLP